MQEEQQEKYLIIKTMTFELIKYDIGVESPANEDGNYSVNITIGIHCTDNVVPDFSKDIISTSNNSQTGTEVDLQREQEVNNYIIAINQ
tara:strand:+ start:341 stop:607 length:267 start_codon:yes stop_codon:yes gene_type:complete